jgi:hypothetical protein
LFHPLPLQAVVRPRDPRLMFCFVVCLLATFPVPIFLSFRFCTRPHVLAKIGAIFPVAPQ